MEQQNLFAEDWINCLRAHYAHVISEHDDNNEKSLISVLLETGFTEGDIAEMRAEVTGVWEQEEVEPELPVPVEIVEESPVPPQRVIAAEADYTWAVPPEPPIIATADETAYEWVLPASDEVAVEALPNEPIEEVAEIVEVTAEEVPAELVIDEAPSAEQIEEIPEITEEVEAVQAQDKRPPDSFVQMSMF